MKKGFTLIELITVIVIIGIIGIITIPIINSILLQNNEKLYDAQLQEISEATEKWAYNNLELLPEEENGVVTLTLLDLKKEGYVTLDLRNPKTGELFPNDMIIRIINSNNEFTYEVDGESGTNITDEYNENAPVIILNGNNIEYVEMNDTYNELGAIAKDKNDNVLSVDTQYKENDIEIPNISTNEIKTYTVVYSATDLEGLYTSYIVRTVVVRDTTEPVITILNEINLTLTEASSFDINSYASVFDNSGETLIININGFTAEVGKHRVECTACDSHNNCTSETVTVNISET